MQENTKKIDRIVNKYVEIFKLPISIIITAYHTQDFIEECLDSIENQTYFKNNNNFEVLVGVDACYSTLDKLKEIRCKYRNLCIFMMKSNQGTYVTSNTLLDLVKYENIIRFDSDDIMKPKMIEIIVSNMEDYDIIKFGYNHFIKNIENTYTSRFHFPHGVVLYKKRVFDIAGGYQNWQCAADTELLERVKDYIKIKELPLRLFYRRQHEDSLTQRTDTKSGSELRLFYKNLIGKHTNLKIEKIINEYDEY
jgi:glycosyltransferase involved in cell wall biosynthesis